MIAVWALIALASLAGLALVDGSAVLPVLGTGALIIAAIAAAAALFLGGSS
ncbi:hypothetical protein ACFW9M_29200 [Streptomyces lydicus]|uniref:hypothetical protein n=1 Tax=Streptomyces lydicus TaxID=47763 RepID=UPI0036C5C197